MIHSVKRVVSAIIRRVTRQVTPSPDAFLKKLKKGVIHVGANTGQERNLYAKLGLNVVWIEPIPDVFAALQSNIQGYPKQRAFEYLVTDKDGQDYQFHISSNEGASSSILELDLHKKLWPGVSFTNTVTMKSVTLISIVEREKLNIEEYDALVLDTQGSELLVLQGAESLLPHFTFIKTEVADFRSYRDCCVLKDVDNYLQGIGFRQFGKYLIKSQKDVGSYYDVIYRNDRR